MFPASVKIAVLNIVNNITMSLRSVRAGQQENGERESVLCNNAVFT